MISDKQYNSTSY